MPATSAKQERFMQAVSHNPAFAKKVGVSQSVGKEFMKKPRKFAGGGFFERTGGLSAAPDDDLETLKLIEKYKKANQLPLGGKATKMGAPASAKASAEEAYDRLQNMREQDIQDRRQETKRKRDAFEADWRKKDIAESIEEARKTGKPYDKYYGDVIKKNRAVGEYYTPERIKSEFPHMFKKGGPVKESKAMVGKEVAFMKKKGAPKSMIKHEAAEMGAMKKGGKVAKYARGGGIELRGKTRGKMC